MMNKKKSVIVLFIVLMLSPIWTPPVQENRADADWLQDFSYRKSHVLTPATGAGTGYQVKIIVNWGYGDDSGGNVYLDMHGQGDFDDIRFTTDDGTTQLDYFMESYAQSQSALFWVEIPSDLSSSEQTIYLYYENATCSTTSSGTDTFPDLFEHFDGDSLPSGWSDWYTEYGSYTVSGSQLRLLGYVGGAGTMQSRSVKTDATFPTNKGLMARITTLVYSDRHSYEWGVSDGPQYESPSPTERAITKTNSAGTVQYWEVENDDAGTNTATAYDVPIVIQICRTTNLAHFYKDGVLNWSTTSNVPDESLPVYFGLFRGAAVAPVAEKLYVDWVAMRNWVWEEPGHGAWGDAEENPDNPPPPILWLSPWQRRKHCVIPQVDGAGTNYQINFTVHYGSGADSDFHLYLNETSQEDFDDLRATASDGETLWDIWDEFNYPGDNCTLWVELRGNLTLGDVGFYIYYDNPAASGVFNGTDTMIAWDNFDDGYTELDPPKTVRNWTVWDQDGTDILRVETNPSGRAGMGLHYKDDATGPQVKIKNQYMAGGTYQPGVNVHFWFYGDVTPGTHHIGMTSSGSSEAVLGVDSQGEAYHWYNFIGWNAHTPDLTLSPEDTWYQLKQYNYKAPASKCKTWSNKDGLMHLGGLDAEGDGYNVWSTSGGYLLGTGYWIDEFFISKYHPDAEGMNFYWGPEESFMTLGDVEIEDAYLIYEDSVLNRWVFANDIYYSFTGSYNHLEGWDSIDQVGIRFNDSYTQVEVRYDFSSDNFYQVSGEEITWMQRGSTTILDESNIQVTWKLYFRENTVDKFNIDIFSWMNDTDGGDSSWLLASDDYFHLYNLGQMIRREKVGTGGMRTGGGNLEAWVGGSYNPADIFEENFRGGYFYPYWVEFEPGDNDVSIATDHFYDDSQGKGIPFESDFWSAKILAKDTVYPVSLTGRHGEQNENFSAQTMIRFSTNVTSHTWVQYVGTQAMMFHVLFGYGTDWDHIHCTDYASIYNTTVMYSPNQWYNLTVFIDVTNSEYDVFLDDALIADDMQWVDTNQGDIPLEIRYKSQEHGTERTTWIDYIQCWRSEKTGFGGTMTTYSYMKNFQHAHLLYGTVIPIGDWVLNEWENRGYEDDFWFYWGVEYGHGWVSKATGEYGREWVDGWGCNITILDATLGGQDNWIRINIAWYEGSTFVREDELYTFWEGFGETGLQSEVQSDWFRLWVDLWVDNENASRVVGGRLNSYYYGMHDSATPWLLIFPWEDNKWGPMGEEISHSSFKTTLHDANGNPISAKELKLMRLKQIIHTSDSMTLQLWTQNYEITDMRYNGQFMEGIDTPIFQETRIPTMPSTGFWAFIIKSLSALGNMIAHSLGAGALSLWTVFVSFLDTIAGWMGYPLAFTNLLSYLTNFWNWMVTGTVWLTTMLTGMMDMLTSGMSKFLTVITYLFSYATLYITYTRDLFDGAWGGATNLWDTFGGTTWLILGCIFYPIYLLWLADTQGDEAAIAHIKMVLDIFSFLISLFIRFIEMVMNIIGRIIESIPVVE